ncbi:MAG: hypothetical protein ACXAEU_26490 [Candidatus Hodarchaeales archaeon]
MTVNRNKNKHVHDTASRLGIVKKITGYCLQDLPSKVVLRGRIYTVHERYFRKYLQALTVTNQVQEAVDFYTGFQERDITLIDRAIVKRYGCFKKGNTRYPVIIESKYLEKLEIKKITCYHSKEKITYEINNASGNPDVIFHFRSCEEFIRISAAFYVLMYYEGLCLDEMGCRKSRLHFEVDAN